MTVTVSKTTVIENIYKNFYDLINAISGFDGTVYSEFPDINVEDKADYPFVVIDSPEIGWGIFTFGRNVLEGTIAINVFTITPKDTDQNASKVNDKIETSKTTLAGVGLRRVELDTTDTDMVPHGSIRVHIKTLTFKYKFYSSKTFAY